MDKNSFLRTKLSRFVLYSGFLCSCGLYEFAGVFWMTYFNPFLQTSIGLTSGDIGTIVLIAQIVDAISNPLVGLLINRLNIPYLGNKRGCHLIGSFIITVSFPFMWMSCWFCSAGSHSQSVAYYSFLAAWMNSMTPFIFLPHLSYIATFSRNEKEKIILSGISSFGKQFWGILAYVTMWVLVGTADDSENLGEILLEKLQIASYIVSAVGVVSTLYFHASSWKFKEKSPVGTDVVGDPHKSTLLRDIKILFKCPNFYILGFVYFLCRSELSLYNVYQVFYYEQTLKLPKEAIAYLPFIYLSTAGVGSMAVKALTKRLKLMKTYLAAVLIVIVSGVALMLQPVEYGNTVIVGIMLFSLGSAIMYTLSLSFTSSLIAQLKVSDVTVWGAYNFLDRVLFGVLFAGLQEFRPCPTSRECCEECGVFYRYVFGGGIIFFAIVAGVLIVVSHNFLSLSRTLQSESGLLAHTPTSDTDNPPTPGTAASYDTELKSSPMGDSEKAVLAGSVTRTVNQNSAESQSGQTVSAACSF